jgi:hypothetical protein
MSFFSSFFVSCFLLPRTHNSLLVGGGGIGMYVFVFSS